MCFHSPNLVEWISLFGMLIPKADAWLAYQAGTLNRVVYKHVAISIYFIVTIVALKLVFRGENYA